MTDKKVLTRDSLLNFKSEPLEFTIKIHGEEHTVFVRPLMSAELVKLQALLPEDSKKADEKYREKAVILGVCDEAGQPLFTDADLSTLSQLPSLLLEGMAVAVIQANVLKPEDVEKAEGN